MRDVSVATGILMFIWGNLTPPRCRFVLLVHTADLSILGGIMSFSCVHVSIAAGILMFIWRKPIAEAFMFFISPHR